jgi:rhodanese-related sulfurtransferase
LPILGHLFDIIRNNSSMKVASDFIPLGSLEITPQEVKQRLDAGEKLRLIDVREVSEHNQARIAGAQLMPMRTVPAHLQTLDDEDGPPLVIFCHHGVRSLQVAQWLREQGVINAQSMSGGIEEWSLKIDASVPRY